MIINPNATESITKNILKSAVSIAAKDTQITGVTSSDGPISIESYCENITASLGVIKEIKKADDSYDAFIIACFGDPGLDAAKEVTEKPVIGIAQASMYMASLVSPKFSIITLIPRTVIPVENLVRRYGMINHLASVRATPLSVLDYEINLNKGMETLVKESEIAIKQDHAEAIILGCAGMTDFTKEIEKQLKLPVIDGVTAAVKMAEGLISLKKQTSKVNTYRWLPENK